MGEELGADWDREGLDDTTQLVLMLPWAPERGLLGEERRSMKTGKSAQNRQRWKLIVDSRIHESEYSRVLILLR